MNQAQVIFRTGTMVYQKPWRVAMCCLSFLIGVQHWRKKGKSISLCRGTKCYSDSFFSSLFPPLIGPRWTRPRGTGTTHGNFTVVQVSCTSCLGFPLKRHCRFPWWFPDMKRLVKSMERSQATGSRPLEVITVPGTTKSVDLSEINFLLRFFIFFFRSASTSGLVHARYLSGACVAWCIWEKVVSSTGRGQMGSLFEPTSLFLCFFPCIPESR